MRKRFYFLSVLLFLSGCLVAQPYSKPPFLYSDITSSGSYDLAGKKFFVSALNYTTLDAAEYDSQKEAFAGYLLESLAMRGAVPVIDSLEADFYVAATLDYRNVSNDVTNYSKESKEFGTNSIKYNGRRTVDNIIEEEKGFGVGTDNVTAYGYSKYSDNLSRHKAKMNELSYRKKDIIVKVVTIEAYDWANGSKNSLWATQAMDSRSAGYIKFLPTDRAMVYLMMRGYGKEMDERKCGISKEDPYFVAFEKSGAPKDIDFLPSSESSDKNLNLFLVEKSDEGIVCLVEDNNLLSMDLKNKNYTAAIRVGNRIIECSKMHYDMPPVQYSRFLTLAFPCDGEELKDFDIIIYRKNKQGKIKHTIGNIQLK